MKLSSTSTVIRRLKKKATLIKKNSDTHKEIKTALIVGGGGMEGVFSMGVLRGLESLGFSEVFDIVIGISAGACDAAYFLSGQTELALSVYINDLTDGHFVDFTRPTKIVDIDYLESVFRTKKKLHVENIKRHQSFFYVTATDDSGKQKLLDVKNSHDVISCLKASMAMPILYNQPVEIDGENFFDGAATKPLPLDYIFHKFELTDVLILLNEPVRYTNIFSSFCEKILSALYLRKFSKKFRDAFLRRNANFHHAIHLLQDSNVSHRINIGVLFPKTKKVGLMTQDKEKIKEELQEGISVSMSLFG